MLTGGLDPMYQAARRSSHTAYLRIEILDGNRNLLFSFDESLPKYLSGYVTATLNSRVARQCRLVFDESMYPFEETDLLAPYGNMIRATRGIEFADGSRFAWTVFLGRIQLTTLDPGGTCTVQAADLAADVLEVKFLEPENSTPGTTVPTEVTRLISDAVPLATFGTFDAPALAVQPLTWQLDRGQALDELATSAGSFWYPLADGDFVLRRYAWTVFSTPVVTYSDGEGGEVVTSSASRAREDVYNSLTVTGERLNGDDAVFATATDNNPASPTFFGGTFGRRHQMLRLQTPSTQGAAQAAADDNLRKVTALVDAWDWEMSVDAALELGDTVALDVRGRSDIIQVVSGFRIPLDLSGPMEVSGRSLIIGVLEAS